MDSSPSTEGRKKMSISVYTMGGCTNCVVNGGTMADSTHQGPTGVIFQNSYVIVEQVTQPLRTLGSVGGSGLPELPQG